MPDQTFFDKYTRIDNLLAEFIEVQKKMNMGLLEQSQTLTQLVAAGLKGSQINIIQKTTPQSSLNNLIYDYRNDRYFEKAGTFFEAKQYVIPFQTYTLVPPYNATDIVVNIGEEMENYALVGVKIQGISVDAIQAGVIIFRNQMSDSGLGYSFTFTRNINPYRNIIYMGIVAAQGVTIEHKLPAPLIFQYRLNDALHLHFRNMHVADQTVMLIMEYVKLKDYE